MTTQHNCIVGITLVWVVQCFICIFPIKALHSFELLRYNQILKRSTFKIKSPVTSNKFNVFSSKANSKMDGAHFLEVVKLALDTFNLFKIVSNFIRQGNCLLFKFTINQINWNPDNFRQTLIIILNILRKNEWGKWGLMHTFTSSKPNSILQTLKKTSPMRVNKKVRKSTIKRKLLKLNYCSLTTVTQLYLHYVLYICTAMSIIIQSVLYLYNHYYSNMIHIQTCNNF